MVYIILTIVPIVVCIGVTAFWQYGPRFCGTRRAPERLFSELCAAHHLSRSEIRAIRMMSELLDGTEPAALFVLSRRFDAAAKLYTETDCKKKTTAMIESIRGRLFGSPTDVASA